MLQSKVDSTKQLRYIDMKVDTLKKSIQRSSITEREVTSLTPDTKVYASIGRMFSLSTIPQLTEEMKTNQTSMEALIKSHEEQKQYLLTSLKEKEDSLRELVQQRKDAEK